MSNQEQLINVFVENWTSVYNTILGREVKITIDSVDKKEKQVVESAVDDFQSFVSLSYGDEASQNIVLALRNKLVSIISNMMIGLDTFKDEITADDKDAFEEAVNQMFSACQVPLKETLGLEMKFRDISFIELGDALTLIGDGKIRLWNCTMDLQDVAVERYVLITPGDFGETEEEHVEEIRVDVPEEKPHTHAFIPGPPMAAPMAQPELAYGASNIGLLLDVELPITVRIGSTEMRLIDIMRLGLGSIIELEKMVDDPVEVLVNDKLVAKGEVVVCDSNFAVRITEVESRAERIKSLV
ncbi:MAG: flagellar motor switch protein FliN [Candidatus Omnitrophota bacterium]